MMGMLAQLAGAAHLRRFDPPPQGEPQPETVLISEFEAGTLGAALCDGIDSRLAGGTPDKNVFSVANHGGASYTRNPAFWLGDVDLTGVSPWNSAGGTTLAGVLITPRHILYADHYPIPNGATVRFVGSDGTVYDRTQSANSGGEWDIRVGVLSSNLPGAITPLKVPPASTPTLLGSAPYYVHAIFPVASLNQSEVAGVQEINAMRMGSWVSIGWLTLHTAARHAAKHNAAIGDSGNPLIAIIDYEPMLVTHWTSSLTGPNYSQLHDYINTQIAAADAAAGISTGFAVEAFDLSEF